MRSRPKRNKSILEKILIAFAGKAFLISLLSVFLAITAGAVLFYNFIILPSQKEPIASNTSARLESEVYQEILNVWEEMEESFEKADLKNYLDFFTAR
jgi:hypothetical protein